MITTEGRGWPSRGSFRQGSTVVIRETVSAGVVLTVDVPLGGVQIFVDGVQMGR